MAFPTVQATSTYFASTSTTAHSANLPASIANGDLLIAIVARRVTAATLSFPAGWSAVSGSPFDGTNPRLEVWTKTADGTEGSTVAINSSAGTVLACTFYRISGWTAVEVGGLATGTSAAGNPNSFSPSWGSAFDVLWIAAISVATGGSVSSAPASYSNLLAGASTSGSANEVVGSAERQLNASSEDPGAFSNTSAQWATVVIAVKPLTGASLAAGVGSFGITGTAATMFKGYIATAGIGSFAITGASAALLANKALAAGVGSFDITGQAATLFKGRTLAAGVGSFAITGAAAALLKQWMVSAGVGSFLITGQNAGMIKDHPVAAGVGAFNITGTAANFVRAWLIPAGVGSFAITGAAAALRNTKTLHVTDVGSFLLSGVDAGFLRRNRIVEAIMTIAAYVASAVVSERGGDISTSAEDGGQSGISLNDF